MTRGIAKELLKELRNDLLTANDKGAESVKLQMYEVEDLIDALKFALDDMESLQDILTITSGIMED